MAGRTAGDRDDRQHDGGIEQRRVGRREVVGDEDVGFGPVGQAGQRQAEADRDRAVAHVVDVGDALGEVAAGAGELVAERLDRLGQRLGRRPAGACEPRHLIVQRGIAGHGRPCLQHRLTGGRRRAARAEVGGDGIERVQRPAFGERGVLLRLGRTRRGPGRHPLDDAGRGAGRRRDADEHVTAVDGRDLVAGGPQQFEQLIEQRSVGRGVAAVGLERQLDLLRSVDAEPEHAQHAASVDPLAVRLRDAHRPRGGDDGGHQIGRGPGVQPGSGWERAAAGDHVVGNVSGIRVAEVSRLGPSRDAIGDARCRTAVSGPRRSGAPGVAARGQPG